jgi:transposase
MGKPLSDDLRERVVEAIEKGISRRAAAERFGISASSAVRWFSTWRTTGAVCAKHQGGDQRSQRIEAFSETILEAINAKVDITLAEIVAMLRDKHEAAFAPSSVWRFLDRHAMTLKKNGARSRAGQARRRRAAQGLVGGTSQT